MKFNWVEEKGKWMHSKKPSFRQHLLPHLKGSKGWVYHKNNAIENLVIFKSAPTGGLLFACHSTLKKITLCLFNLHGKYFLASYYYKSIVTIKDKST